MQREECFHVQCSQQRTVGQIALDRWVTAGALFWRRFYQGEGCTQISGKVVACSWFDATASQVSKELGQVEFVRRFGDIWIFRFEGEPDLWGGKFYPTQCFKNRWALERELAQRMERHSWFVGGERVVFDGDSLEILEGVVSWRWREGKTFSEILWKEGASTSKDSFSRRVRWIEQLLQALSLLHQEGWLHNDLKISNLLLSPKEEVLLLDWSAATRLEEKHLWGEQAEIFEWGSPYTIAPERLRGGPPSIAAEIYALGATIYHVFSGVLYQGQMPPLRSFCPYLPSWLDGLLSRMLSYDPLQRPSLAEVQMWWKVLSSSLQNTLGEASPSRRKIADDDLTFEGSAEERFEVETSTSSLGVETKDEDRFVIVGLHLHGEGGAFAQVSPQQGVLRLGSAYEVVRKGRILGVIRLRSLWLGGVPCSALKQKGVVQWVGFSSFIVGDQLRYAPSHERSWGEWIRPVSEKERLGAWYALCYGQDLVVGQRLQCLRGDRHCGYAWLSSVEKVPFSEGVGFLVRVEFERVPTLREGDFWQVETLQNLKTVKTERGPDEREHSVF